MLSGLLLVCAPATQLDGGAWEELLRVPGLHSSDALGISALAVGDRDGDQVEDFVVTQAPWPSSHAAAMLMISGANGSLLRQFDRPPVNDRFGSGLALGSDLNGDGVREIYVGAMIAMPLSGLDSGLVRVLSGSTLQALQLWQPTPGSRYFGASVCNIGDQDGDGIEDFAVSAPYTPLGVDLGRIEYRSGVDGSVFGLFEGGHRYLGGSLASLPDVDGDGKRELFAGSKHSYNNLGAVLVIGSLTKTALLEIRGTSGQDYLGESVCAAGDLNHDGRSELLALAGGYGAQRILLYEGSSGALLRTFHPPLNHDLHSVGLLSGADFDGDGSLDIVAPYRSNQYPSPSGLILYHLDGSGERRSDFVPGTTEEFGAYLAPIRATHADGSAELLVCDRRMDVPGTGAATGAVLRMRFAPLLEVDRRSLRASRGGTLRFRLNFADAEAGHSYVLLGSAAAAGSSSFSGLAIPLVQDSFFTRMLTAPPASFTGARGSLDGNGDAIASWSLAPGAGVPWVGRTIRFAVVTGSAGAARMSSVAQHLTILP